jgi:hypothetical protein
LFLKVRLPLEAAALVVAAVEHGAGAEPVPRQETAMAGLLR